jgi:ArsR family transcriptional regulator
MAKVELSSEQFQRIARAVSDPNRWEMLRLIFAQAETTCGCVSDALPITAPTASHHLKELEVADLVSVTKCGRYKMLAPKRDVWRAYLAMLREL